LIDIGRFYMTDFLTPNELAARWRLSAQAIRRKVSSGRIPCFRAPGSRALKIPADFVTAYESAFPHAVNALTPTPTTAI
jgi:hypothetical protein